MGVAGECRVQSLTVEIVWSAKSGQQAIIDANPIRLAPSCVPKDLNRAFSGRQECKVSTATIQQIDYTFKWNIAAVPSCKSPCMSIPAGQYPASIPPLITMLRSLPRAGNSSLYLRPCLRITTSPSRSPNSACTAVTPQHQTRSASSAHAISNPTLAGIEKRWEVMPPQEQADLWMALRDRMKIDWHDLTIQEKKAGGCSFSTL